MLAKTMTGYICVFHIDVVCHLGVAFMYNRFVMPNCCLNIYALTS